MNKGILYLSSSKEIITEYMLKILREKENEIISDVPWVKDSYARLENFAVNGKMVRGGLVLLSSEMFGEKISAAHLAIASGIEFFHSALLIHDDIMDNDYMRRGKQSLFAQYEEFAKTEKIAATRDFGNGMAICLGDNSLFLVFSIIGSADISESKKNKLLSYFTKEAQIVGFGQMQDLYLSKMIKEPTEEEIFSVYKYKTARYTFSLPMVLGAILAGKDDKLIKNLEILGEKVGLIFQIRDDELRYFDDAIKIGKTTGSDIRENTKTIFRNYLFTRATTAEKEKLKNIFGNPKANEEDFGYVRTLMKEKNIFADIQKKVSQYRMEAEALISSLEIDSSYKKILFDLITYMYERKS